MNFRLPLAFCGSLPCRTLILHCLPLELTRGAGMHPKQGLDFFGRDLVVEVVRRVRVETTFGVFGRRIHKETALFTLGLRQRHVVRRVVGHPM